MLCKFLCGYRLAFLWDISLGTELLGHVFTMFCHLGNCLPGFLSSCTISRSHQQWVRILVSQHLHQHLWIISTLFIIAIPFPKGLYAQESHTREHAGISSGTYVCRPYSESPLRFHRTVQGPMVWHRGCCSHSGFLRNAQMFQRASRQWGIRPQPHSIHILLLMENQALGRKEIGLKGNECDILRHAIQSLGLWVETWLRSWPSYSLKSPLWSHRESCWGALTS